ncbi:MAG: HRDC domain-containing protein [Pseudomonadota bacterium]
MVSTPTKNHELELARDFVQNTGCHIFLTGKAGTGKTTFLQTLKKSTPKRMIVTAPTGVAAVNAGGVTLHSFFQLPFGPFIPGSESWDKNRQRLFRFSKEKKRIIRGLDLLVIDEISMVRADLLDCVDSILRFHRNTDKPFGGVQLLMIGDLHQLAPVAKPGEWQILQQHYPSVYFFSSQALSSTDLVTIELTHIYRQADPKFIELLSRVRNNRLDEHALDLLNQRYNPSFKPDRKQGYITLTTHNRNADAINAAQLNELPGNGQAYDADVTGDFPDHTFPAPGSLTLKPGAQVMFLRNDASPQKRYYNGKIGTVATLSRDRITVECPDDPESIHVEPVEWENITYTVNPETHEIQTDIIGRFKQFPLKPAWAITIHKSQGLTFDNAVIDAESAFSHGQFYVALSRCRTLGGIVLSSRIPSQGIAADDAVLDFIETARRSPASLDRLRAARITFGQQLLLECFDFQKLGSRLSWFVRLIQGSAGRVKVSGLPDPAGLKDNALKQIVIVGDRFRQQLISLFTDQTLPESDPHIQERTSKASAWFQEKFSELFQNFGEAIQMDTDNRELARKINNGLDNLRQEIALKLAGVTSCQRGFSCLQYLRALSDAGMGAAPDPKKKPRLQEYTDSDIQHPELFQALKDWRSNKAQELGVARFLVLHQRVLIQIATDLPCTETDLKQIHGVGKKTLENHGNELLSLVMDYRKKSGMKKIPLPGADSVNTGPGPG